MSASEIISAVLHEASSPDPIHDAPTTASEANQTPTTSTNSKSQPNTTSSTPIIFPNALPNVKLPSISPLSFNPATPLSSLPKIPRFSQSSSSSNLQTISELPASTDLMDVDTETPFKRALALIETHPLLHRRSLTTIDLTVPSTNQTYAIHIGQIAQYINFDHRLRRGLDADRPPLGFVLFASLFNSADSIDTHGIRFCSYDESIASSVVPPGKAPYLNDFEIDKDIVNPPSMVSNLDARLSLSSSFSKRPMKNKLARGGPTSFHNRPRGTHRSDRN